MKLSTRQRHRRDIDALKTALEGERARVRIADQRADENAENGEVWKKQAEASARRVEEILTECRKHRAAIAELDIAVARLAGYQERVKDEDRVRLLMAGCEPSDANQ